MEVKMNKKTHPREKSSIFSHWFFCWELPLLHKGYRKQLTDADLHGPLKAHRSQKLGDQLEQAWILEKQKKNEKAKFWKALAMVFGWEFAMYGLILIPLELVIKLSQPLLLGKLVDYFNPNQDGDVSTKEAYIYASFIVITSFLNVLIGHSYYLGLEHLGMKIRIACSSLVYRKSLKLACGENDLGHMINLLANDVGRFDYAILQFHFLWMAPLETVVIMVLLYFWLGGTAIIGIALLLSFIPFQMFLSKKISRFRLRTAQKTDNRVRLMNEIVGGIKVIKMYTWEKAFAALIQKARKLELAQIRSSSYLRGLNMACQIFLSRSAIFLCIITYVTLGNHLQPEYVYVLTAFYDIIRLGSVIFFPLAMTFFGETVTSLQRISKFLHKIEVGEEVEPATGRGITMKGVTVQLSPSFTLNTTCDIVPEELVAVIGPVGSGKSTLLQILLGEVQPQTGTCTINGTISYAPQEPWLFSGTIRENILFGGEDFDRERYGKVVKACALESDFALFPHGDGTFVGEKGVMLSGGQKARVNLARALYKKADLYLLDDPLSSVDAHVAKQLFQNGIKHFLEGKTRVLVTHQLQFLAGVDSILLLEGGRITARGTFEQLKQNPNEYLLQLLEMQGEGSTVEEGIIEMKEAEEEVKEVTQEGAVSGTVYHRFFQAGGTILASIFMVLLHVLVQTVANGTDYFLAYWVNLEQVNKPSHYCLYFYSALSGTMIIIAIFATWYFFRFCLKASSTLHQRMLSKIVFSPMRFFHLNPSGRILNRFSKDMGLIDENLPLSLMDTMEIALAVLAITIIISIINPWILVPTVLMFAIFYFYRLVFLATSRNLKRIEGKARSPIFSHVASSSQGLPTIRAFKAQTKAKGVFDDLQDDHSSSYYLFLACDSTFGFWLDMTCVVYLGLVTFSFLLMEEKFGGNVGLAITQSIMMTGMLQWGMKQWSNLENQMTAVERVVEYGELEVEPLEPREKPNLWPPHGQLDFKQVSLQYGEEEPMVLHNLNFSIKSGEKVGVVGRTGAGKSSLITIIFHLVPFQGNLLIDGTDTKEVGLEVLRSRISIIPQEPVLFTGSVRHNLDPLGEYQDHQIWEALAEVELKSTIDSLHLKVNEGGMNFSVGQKQLLCLARALLRHNKILILDEATANVDPKTDEFIQSTIRNKFKECTVLTIAHRLNTIMDSDRVLVMDAGRVVEFGQPLQLLQNPQGVFTKLVEEAGVDK